MRKYYIQNGDKLEGPYSVEELKDAPINFHTRLCKQGTNEWKTITEIEDFEQVRLSIKPDLEKKKKAVNTSQLLKTSGIIALIGIVIFGVISLVKSRPSGETKVVTADTLKVDSLNSDSLNKAKKTSVTPIRVNDNVTNFSSMLAGIIPDNMRDKLEDNSSWIDIQGAMHEEWERVVTDKVLPIQEWTDESPLAKLDSGILFYPFAGADFLYSNCFFPRSNRIVMVGLEPIGSISEKLEFNSDFYDYMKRIKTSLYTSNRSGYFMTINMGKELRQSDLNGVLPLILFYARRQSFLISSIEYVSLDENGKQIPSTYQEAAGVVIKLTDNDRKTLKTIEYYRTDLSDGEFKPGSRFHNYFSAFQNKNVFLKAASYLLHNDSFSNIRNVILENTNTLLQDDSGMPYKYVATNDWNVELYGKYTRPIGLFSSRVQSDLREEFQKRGGKELPFRIGYNISHNEPHLILAQRKK
ncbi:MAG: GYF domain-containing protein [Bacteroidia bacterium]